VILKCPHCGGSGLLTASDGSWKHTPEEWIDATRDESYCLCYECAGEGLTYDIESEASHEVPGQDAQNQDGAG